MSQFAKTVLYQKDGTGRDTYIAFNNGGIIKNTLLTKGGYERGLINQRRQYCPTVLPTRAKMIHYSQNGTGRDSYISYNQGGFSETEGRFNNTCKSKFIQQLRAYEPINRNRRVLSTHLQETGGDYQYKCTTGQRTLKSAQLSIHTAMLTQKIEQLSKAKVSEDPYAQFRKSWQKKL